MNVTHTNSQNRLVLDKESAAAALRPIAAKATCGIGAASSLCNALLSAVRSTQTQDEAAGVPTSQNAGTSWLSLPLCFNAI
jgi:hypothetical protein